MPTIRPAPKQKGLLGQVWEGPKHRLRNDLRGEVGQQGEAAGIGGPQLPLLVTLTQ